MAFENGPYVAAAFFCERAILETDNVPTYVRVVDTFAPSIQLTGVAEGAEPDDAQLRLAVLTPFFFVLSVKAGGVTGEHHLEVVPVNPNGEELPRLATPVQLDGGVSGVNLVIQVTVQQPGEAVPVFGEYWWTVLFDGEVLTRLPMRVVAELPAPGLS